MPNPTISMPEEMQKRIHEDLDYGDSKSHWIRQAVKYRFLVDEYLDDELTDEEKLKVLEDALKQIEASQ